MIKKDSKNQVKLEATFYDLYNDNQKNNIIELNEENNKNNNNNKINKIEKEKEELNNKVRKIDNEINYVNSLINEAEKKLSLYREKYNNNFLDINLDQKNTNKNKNSNDNTNINTTLDKKDNNQTLEPNIWDLINIFNLNLNEEPNNNSINKNDLENFFKSGLKQQNDKKDFFTQLNKEQNGYFYDEECINLLNYETNKNAEEYIPKKNMNNNLRKDSFISDFSELENLKGFNCGKDNIFSLYH